MSLLMVEQARPGVTLIRLNRPEARNALSPALRRMLRDQFRRLGEESDARVIVITGDERAFAAGADIKAMVDATPGDMMRRGDEANWEAIRTCPKPVIAAVDGYALGGGCELAMHADLIVAGENAKFGQPEVKLGIMPGAGGTQRLARAVGLRKAMLMLLTGETMTAREAFEAGLVARVVPPGQTVGMALDIAETIAAMPQLAVAEIKRTLHAGLDAPLDVALMLERRAAYLLFDSDDRREATQAFIDKRKPVFSGH